MQPEPLTGALPTPARAPTAAFTPSPLPSPLHPPPPIGPENAAGVRLLALLQSTGGADPLWSSQGDWLALPSAEGVSVYAPGELSAAAQPAAPPAGRFVRTGALDSAEVSLSPGGHTLAVRIVPQSLFRRWEVASGEELGALAWSQQAAPLASGALFSPDWSTLAWYARGTVWFVDVSSGAEMAALSHEDSIQSVAFSADGEFFASASMAALGGQTLPIVQLWDVGDNEPAGRLSGHAGYASLLRFSPLGGLLAAVDGGGDIAVWDLAARQLARILPGFAGGVRQLAFSPDDRYLAAGSPQGEVRFWELENGRQAGHWQGELAALSPQGRLLALRSAEGQIALLDMLAGKALQELEGPSDLGALAFSPGGRFLAGMATEPAILYLWGVPP